MEISQGSLAYMLLLSFLLGAVLGAIYDAVRIIRVFLTLGEDSKSKFALSAIRKLKLPWLDKEKLTEKLTKKKKIVALPLIFFALDFVYALLCGCAFILLEYYANDGTPRAFSFFGVLLGFVLYYFSLGRLVLAISERIAFVIRIMLAYLALPFERVFSLISAYLDKAKQKRLLRQKKKKAMDFDKKKRAELALCASDAFLEFEKE